MKKNLNKRAVNEAVDGGWEVPDHMAREAYDFACDRLGKENVDSQIVDVISHEELANCLAFIFRMNDFREWDEYMKNKENEDEEEEGSEYLNEAVRRAVRKFLKENVAKKSK